ncbi:MAG: DUF4105 domain-containing protein [Helicobacteraceae bacterium]|jgi:hypothetical protein|nr:DUF4105 domain-containing protein [Helicobacteraceae bacterium]
MNLKFLLILALPIVLFASYAQELKTKAIDLNLSDHPRWRGMVGYKTAIFGGVQSAIDDRRFFLAKNGATDPQSELLATIDSFFAGSFDGNASLDTRCIFTARWRFLKEALEIDESRLTPTTCEAFEHWYNSVRGDRLFLIFPAAYMNNPASTFGHTFLRIDKNDSSNALTSYAINYEAYIPPGESDLAFVFKGLSGGYDGYFSALPYAQKAKDYGDLENRDIWEYELNFTREEIDLLLHSAWEFHNFSRDYYFFKENCSFVLLELLEYAKGGIDLTSRFTGFAAPVDTIRALLNEPDMLKSARFRPSRNSRIAALARRGGDDISRLAGEIAYGKIAPREAAAALGREEAIAALELAMEFIEYLSAEDEIDFDLYKKRLFSSMSARSSLGLSAEPIALKQPSVRPDQGHLISRAALGAGYDNHDNPSANFRIRVSYHDMVDPPMGFAAGSSINAADLWIQSAEDATRVRRFTLLNMESFAPRNRFFSPISWRFALGWQDNPPSFERGGYGYFKGGAGLGWGDESLIYYVCADAETQAGKRLYKERAFYAGGSIGLIAAPFERVRARFEAKRDYDLANSNKPRTQMKLEAGYALETNLALRLEFAGEKLDRSERNEAFIFIDYFF